MGEPVPRVCRPIVLYSALPQATKIARETAGGLG